MNFQISMEPEHINFQLSDTEVVTNVDIVPPETVDHKIERIKLCANVVKYMIANNKTSFEVRQVR